MSLRSGWMLGLAVAVVSSAVSVAHADTILAWNTTGNAGTETSEPSVTNITGVSPSNLTLGAGVTPSANTNRFGGSNWFDTGDAQPPTLANSISGNDYIEFIVTPDPSTTIELTGLSFIWDRSGTGPDNVTLRSSADSFGSDLGSATSIPSSTSTFTNIPFALTITSATTFRLYGWDVATGGTAGTSGTAGFDTVASALNPNVVLTGNVPEPASLGLLGLGGLALLARRRK